MYVIRVLCFDGVRYRSKRGVGWSVDDPRDEAALSFHCEADAIAEQRKPANDKSYVIPLGLAVHAYDAARKQDGAPFVIELRDVNGDVTYWREGSSSFAVQHPKNATRYASLCGAGMPLVPCAAGGSVTTVKLETAEREFVEQRKGAPFVVRIGNGYLGACEPREVPMMHLSNAQRFDTRRQADAAARNAWATVPLEDAQRDEAERAAENVGAAKVQADFEAMLREPHPFGVWVGIDSAKGRDETAFVSVDVGPVVVPRVSTYGDLKCEKIALEKKLEIVTTARDVWQRQSKFYSGLSSVLSKECDSFKEQCARLQDERDTLLEKISFLEAVRANQGSMIREEREKVAERGATITRLGEMTSEMSAQNSALRNSGVRVGATIAQLQKQNDTQAETINGCDAKIKRLEAEVTTAKRCCGPENDKQAATIEELQRVRLELIEDRDRIKARLDAERKQFGQLEEFSDKQRRQIEELDTRVYTLNNVLKGKA